MKIIAALTIALLSFNAQAKEWAEVSCGFGVCYDQPMILAFGKDRIYQQSKCGNYAEQGVQCGLFAGAKAIIDVKQWIGSQQDHLDYTVTCDAVRAYQGGPTVLQSCTIEYHEECTHHEGGNPGGMN